MKGLCCKIKLWCLHAIDRNTSIRGEILIPLNTIDFNQISTFVKKIGPVTI